VARLASADHPILRHLTLRSFTRAHFEIGCACGRADADYGLKGSDDRARSRGRITNLVGWRLICGQQWASEDQLSVFPAQLASVIVVWARKLTCGRRMAGDQRRKFPRFVSDKVGDNQNVRLKWADRSRVVAVPPTGDFAFPALVASAFTHVDPPIPHLTPWPEIC